MEISDIQYKYNQTFGKIDKTNKSYIAFINLLYELGEIDDTQYFNLKQRNKSDNFDIIGENNTIKKLMFVPLFEDFMEEIINNNTNDISLFSEIYDNLEKANYIILKEDPIDDTDLNYKKTYNDKGIVQWLNTDTNETFDNETMANVINDKLQEYSNSMVMHDDYLNIIRGKDGEKYFDVKGMFDLLNNMYFIITGSQIESQETWGTLLKFAEDGGIINNQQKNILYNQYGEK